MSEPASHAVRRTRPRICVHLHGYAVALCRGETVATICLVCRACGRLRLHSERFLDLWHDWRKFRDVGFREGDHARVIAGPSIDRRGLEQSAVEFIEALQANTLDKRGES